MSFAFLFHAFSAITHVFNGAKLWFFCINRKNISINWIFSPIFLRQWTKRPVFITDLRQKRCSKTHTEAGIRQPVTSAPSGLFTLCSSLTPRLLPVRTSGICEKRQGHCGRKGRNGIQHQCRYRRRKNCRRYESGKPHSYDGYQGTSWR